MKRQSDDDIVSLPLLVPELLGVIIPHCGIPPYQFYCVSRGWTALLHLHCSADALWRWCDTYDYIGCGSESWEEYHTDVMRPVGYVIWLHRRLKRTPSLRLCITGNRLARFWTRGIRSNWFNTASKPDLKLCELFILETGRGDAPHKLYAWQHFVHLLRARDNVSLNGTTPVWRLRLADTALPDCRDLDRCMDLCNLQVLVSQTPMTYTSDCPTWQLFMNCDLHLIAFRGECTRVCTLLNHLGRERTVLRQCADELESELNKDQ